MSWIGVITDVGKNLIAEYASGSSAINVTKVTVGSGIVSTEDMHEATALQTYKDDGYILSKTTVQSGVDFEIQIQACLAGSYKAKEIGLWANVEGSNAVLLALFQNTSGVDIPAMATNPDFAYVISAVLAIDNIDNLTITVDTAAFVTYSVFNPYRESVAAALDGKVDKETGKGLSQANFTNEEKLKLAGIEEQANNYTLPIATASELGGVKVGTGVAVSGTGVLTNSGVRSVATGSANGTVSVNTNGTAADVAVKGLASAAYTEAGAYAAASHNHSAANITSGTLVVARGGTGITSDPSMLTNLASTTAANVFAASPRPGVVGTLPIANGGTGLTASPSMLTNLGSTSAANVLAASPRPGVTGTLPVANGGTGATTASGALTNLGAAAASHNHSAANITSGTLAVARGGTGLTASPSMLTNLGSTTAANVLAASPRPGVTGTLGAANGGTGNTSLKAAGSAIVNALDTNTSVSNAEDFIVAQSAGGGTTTTTYYRRALKNVRVGGLTTARKLKVALGSTTDITFDGTADKTTIPVSGTLPIANGGTGLTSSPSMLTNLGSTTAANILAASPRPGVTGTLPVANGGTGATTAANARTNLGAAAATHTHTPNQVTGFPDTIGFYTGNSPTVWREINLGYKPSKVILFALATGSVRATANTYYGWNYDTINQGGYLGAFWPGRNLVGVYSGDSSHVTDTDEATFKTYLQAGHGGAMVTSKGFQFGGGAGNDVNNISNEKDWHIMYWAWK